jgi:pimeloyl-ACP methyl ester carboxylesterase
MKFIKQKLLLFLLITTLIFAEDTHNSSAFTVRDIKTIKQLKKPLRPINNVLRNEEVFNYLTYYNLPFDVSYSAGYIRSAQYHVYTQIFSPVSSRRTVLFIHGYLDHTGINYYLIKELLEHKYTVVTIDLPGHGLSTGKRADINSFSEYGAVLNNTLKVVKNVVPQKIIIMGHSTGCAVSFEYMRVFNDYQPLYVFISPLIRSYMWDVSKIGVPVIKFFTPTIFRRYGADSSNPNTEELKRNELLRIDDVPFNWFDSLVDWNLEIEQVKPMVFSGSCFFKVKMIQL